MLVDVAAITNLVKLVDLVEVVVVDQHLVIMEQMALQVLVVEVVVLEPILQQAPLEVVVMVDLVLL